MHIGNGNNGLSIHRTNRIAGLDASFLREGVGVDLVHNNPRIDLNRHSNIVGKRVNPERVLVKSPFIIGGIMPTIIDIMTVNVGIGIRLTRIVLMADCALFP